MAIAVWPPEVAKLPLRAKKTNVVTPNETEPWLVVLTRIGSRIVIGLSQRWSVWPLTGNGHLWDICRFAAIGIGAISLRGWSALVLIRKNEAPTSHFAVDTPHASAMK